MSDRDPVALRDAAIAFAREAGAILREGFGRTHVAERKGAIDLVTEYDKRSEALVLGRIHERFPNHRVLAEESGTQGGQGAVRWVIDPLDGTTNFAHNYPFFCVSIGVEVDGRMAAGAIYDPVRDEMFAAAQGRGATLNDQPIRVSTVGTLQDALLVTGFPYDVREHPDRHLGPFRAFLTRAQALRRDGSAALNLAYLAMGRFDGFWELWLSPWDLAAGTLIVQEAGGQITRWNGSAFSIEGKELLASNGRLHEEMLDVLKSC